MIPPPGSADGGFDRVDQLLAALAQLPPRRGGIGSLGDHDEIETVAAFLTMLDNGEVAAGGGSLNQQTVYGADVISRLAAAIDDPTNAERLHRLALASINQAVDSLNLSQSIRNRIQRVTIVGNVAMHHLLTRLPLDTLAMMPFQPHRAASMPDATDLMGGIFPESAVVSLPPLVGGFVGSDALACLAYFGFEDSPGPMAAIDLDSEFIGLISDMNTKSVLLGGGFKSILGLSLNSSWCKGHGSRWDEHTAIIQPEFFQMRKANSPC